MRVKRCHSEACYTDSRKTAEDFSFRRRSHRCLSQRCSIRKDLAIRSEEHTSELQSPCNLVCRLLVEKKTKSEFATSRYWGRSVSARGQRVSDRLGAWCGCLILIFFFNDTATTEIYTLSLHDALPI